MHLSRLLRPALATAAILATLSTTKAIVLPYDVAGGSVSANSNSNGLIINTSINANLSNVAFNLNDGQSATFPFFNIWTPESSIQNDDLAHLPINATLNFTIPLIGANVSGVTFGGSLLFGLTQWGQVQWSAPALVTVGDRTFQVSLSDETFNYGFFGLSSYMTTEGATVYATVTQISSNISTPRETPAVPDAGATSALLGIGMLALAATHRRLRRAQS